MQRSVWVDLGSVDCFRWPKTPKIRRFFGVTSVEQVEYGEFGCFLLAPSKVGGSSSSLLTATVSAMAPRLKKEMVPSRLLWCKGHIQRLVYGVWGVGDEIQSWDRKKIHNCICLWKTNSKLYG